MCNAGTDEKKTVAPQNLPQKLSSRSYILAILASKMNFLDPKNPHVAIFRHRIASKMELQHCFQNFPLVAKNSTCGNFKTT